MKPLRSTVRATSSATPGLKASSCLSASSSVHLPTGMKGIRFYHEFEDRSKCRSRGTIVAACVCNGSYISSDKLCYEGLVGVFDRPNSPVNFSGAALDYLREKCKR